MAKILSFPNKKNDNELSKLHDDVLIEEHKIKLKTLYAQMQHVLKEINYHKEVLRLLQEGNK
jgi:hypothetical protein